jgi:hypothetical protein
MKPAFKIASHAAALLLGLALAAAVQRMGADRHDADAKFSAAGKEDADAAAKAAKNKKGKSSTGGIGNSRAAAYRAAWAALPKEPLNLKDRMAAQRKLLAEWAKIDLEGALAAYLGEAWDARDPMYQQRDPLGQAFMAAFQEHPLETWKVLSKDRMACNLLGRTWIQATISRDPGLAISLLGEVPEQFHRDALTSLFNERFPGAKDRKEEFLAKLASAGSPTQVEKWMQEIYRQSPQAVDPATLSAQWAASASGSPSPQQMAAWASALGKADASTLAGEWEKVPEADRGQAARMLLSQVDNHSPALLDAIGLAIDAGEWTALSQGVCDKLRGFQTDRQTLAEWALDLPPKEEVRLIYNLAISEKLLADPAGGRAWLEQLPAGDWHRESGFIEMMLGSLWVRGDSAAAQKAIDSITDPAARHQAETDRYNWQLITNQKGVVRGK